MRILLINNFFRPIGGVERVFFLERKMLAERGHTVIDFSSQHENNAPSPYAKHFVSGVDFRTPGHFWQKALRFFYAREVDQKLSELIKTTRPQVAHIHGIFDVLGPTVINTLARHKIPIVFTAHAYKLICPNWKLFAQGKIDEQCRDNPWHDTWNRSIQNSWIKSFGAVASWQWQNWHGTYQKITTIISPSKFLIDKHVEFGWARKRFVHIPNPVDVNVLRPAQGINRFILFVGRLVPEKGVDVLLAAAAQIKLPIVIIGDGPERQKLSELARANKLNQVMFLGERSPSEVQKYLNDALAVVVPSLWYENDPYAVLEAQAQGKIVIASAVGGIPEQIQNGETGFLFAAGDAAALAKTVNQVNNLSAEERAGIGRRARGLVDTVRNPEFYYESVLSVLLSAVR